MRRRLVVGISGASGIEYGVRALIRLRFGLSVPARRWEGMATASVVDEPLRDVLGNGRA